MATFNTKKILYASPSLIPTIAERISDQFRAEGYEVNSDQLSNTVCLGNLAVTNLFYSTRQCTLTLFRHSGNCYAVKIAQYLT